MTLIFDSKREQLGQGEPDFSQLAMEHRAASALGGFSLTTIKFEDDLDEDEEYEYEDEFEEDAEEGDSEDGEYEDEEYEEDEEHEGHGQRPQGVPRGLLLLQPAGGPMDVWCEVP